MKTVRRLLPFCLLTALLLALPSAGRAQLSFTTNNGAITITACAFNITQVVIPASTNGYPVTKIGDLAFNCAALTSLELPNSIIAIGNSAFSACDRLTNVVLDANLKSIGAGAFDLTKLTSVTIPAGVTNIGRNAFGDCASLTNIAVEPASSCYSSLGGVLFNASQAVLVEFPSGVAGSYSIPGSVTNLGAFAFDSCILTNLTIPASVVSIGDSAFSYCRNLSAVVFKGNAPQVGVSIFDYAHSLTVYYQSGTSGWGSSFAGRPTALTSSIWPYSFIITNGTVVITGCPKYLEYFNIPSSIDNLPVTGISAGAFDGCYLFSVVLPDTVVTIGNDAFRDCHSLTNITFGTGVIDIGDSAFEACRTLSAVVLPDAVVTIGNGAFRDCHSLTTITFGTNVMGIGSSAFAACSALASVLLPVSVTGIGSNAFNSCSSLAQITIPEQVTNIASQAFMFCNGLTNVTILAQETSLGDNAFSECSALSLVTISNRITSLGNGVFSYCTNLACCAIPEGVNLFTDELFVGCSSLTNVIIPSTVTSIGNHCFLGCEHLVSIQLPGGLTNLGALAFYECARLTNLMIPNGVQLIGDGAFYACGSLINLSIPDSVTNIGTEAFSECTNLVAVVVGQNHPVYGSLDGVLFDKNQATLVCYPSGKAGGYVIPGQVTSVHSWAFEGCARLTAVTIPSGVADVGSGAFYACASLASVTIPNSVTNIGEEAFSACTNLVAIVVSLDHPVYGSLDGVLFDKSQTTLLCYPAGKEGGYVIPDRVTSIVNWAFEGCAQLTAVTIPTSVNCIGNGAFDSCTSLDSLAIPAGVTNIGDWMFAGCTHLTHVLLPDSVTSIGEAAFDSCASLTSIVLPAGLANLANFSFDGCSQLTGIYFKGNSPFNDYWPTFGADNATLYYLPGKTGWGTPTQILTYPIALWLPALQNTPASFGGPTHQFGFNINWAAGQTVVVEASTNLINWQPVQTNTLANDSAWFADADSTNYPGCYYRLRSP